MRGGTISLGGNEMIPAVPSIRPCLEGIIDGMENMDVRTNKPNKEVWRDLEPGRRECLYLEKLSFREIVRLGEATFPQLTWHVTDQTVGRLMLLAYNTMDRGASVFDFVPVDLMDPALSIDVDDLHNDPWWFAEVHHPVEYFGTIDDPSKDDWDNMQNVARGICYLACSYLRLFSISAQSYIRLGHHLEDGFARFYSSCFPLIGYRLSFEALRNMKMMMETIPYLKNTFYNILYAGETRRRNGESLKDFLYGNHVRYTGLLGYRLFLKCMGLMKLSSRKLAKIIYTKKFDSELRAICGIFSKLQPSESNGTELGMWKYACIFDQTFLRPLQEKKSHLFTLSLAMMIKELVPPGEFDPLQMVEISNSTPCMLDMANYFAKRAVVIYAATRASPGYGETVESKVVNDRQGTGRPRGFGFVTSAPGRSIPDAMEGMNYRNLDGRNITVKEAQSRGSSGGGGYRGGDGGWYSGNSGRFTGGGYWRRGGSPYNWRD